LASLLRQREREVRREICFSDAALAARHSENAGAVRRGLVFRPVESRIGHGILWRQRRREKQRVRQGAFRRFLRAIPRGGAGGVGGEGSGGIGIASGLINKTA